MIMLVKRLSKQPGFTVTTNFTAGFVPPCYDVASNMMRDGGRVFSPTLPGDSVALSARSLQTQAMYRRPRPVLRPQRALAVGGLLPRKGK
jgi:hypothetical protein